MHLIEIRISGFKTFVDYTKIKINQDLVCVVGPNGCGKSNILDAIRWVLGESSNKLIRTEVNEDVIFNGAKGRARSDRASVELIFDNSDQKITGQFKEFNQISIKRELFRDEPSKYSINQQRVRRKDIINLFLGTGLGVNSYALIQQGLVSQIVESKPDELREMIEEAAQISGYKQRRHESSLKIKNTLENLARVNDLKTEISEQCRYLNNQAKAAKRFHKLKNELIEKKFLAIAFEYQYLAKKKQSLESKILQFETQIEKINAKISALETEMVQYKQTIFDLNQNRSEIEKNRYEKGREIARLEERIKQIEYDLSTKDQRIGALEKQIEQITTKLNQEKANQNQLKLEINQLEKDLQAQEQNYKTHQNEFEQIEKIRQDHLLKIASAESKKNNLNSYLKNRQISMSQFDQTLIQQNQQLKKITTEIEAIHLNQLKAQFSNAKSEVEQAKNKLNQSQEKEQAIGSKYAEVKEKFHSIEKQLTDLNHQNSEIVAKIWASEQMIVSLEGEQLNQSKKELESHHINYSLFAEKITINPQYQSLIGSILPDIAAISLSVEDEKSAIQWLVQKLESKQKVVLEWFVNHQQKVEKNDLTASDNQLDLPRLIDFFETSQGYLPKKLSTQLSQIFVCKDLKTALSYRKKLANHQSILTHQGVWFSSDWFKVIDLEKQSSHSPVLAREKLKKDQQTSKKIQSQIDKLKEKKTLIQNQLKSTEIEKNDAMELLQIEKTALNQKRQNLTHSESELLWQGKRLDELNQAKLNLTQSIKSNQFELNKLKNWDNDSEKIELEKQLNDLKNNQEKIDQKFKLKKTVYEQLREKLQQDQQKLSNQKLEFSFITKTIESINAEKTKSEITLSQLVGEQNNQQVAKKQDLQKQLNRLLNDHQKQDQQISELHSQINQISDQFNGLENQLKENKENYYKIDKHKNAATIEVEQAISNQRQCLEDLIRLDKSGQSNESDQSNQDLTKPTDNQASQSVNQTSLEKRLIKLANEHFHNQQEIEHTHLDAIKDEIDRLEIKLSKMGSVNLNAIEDFEQAQKKLDYLVDQSGDIEQALNTLKQAIHKIDHQTKSMFETTFNALNQSFGEFFPTLFGGGSAKLVLIENDLLTSGVIIDAKPYGKKNKQISMLSGGEKALTAIALIFSFFSLNPVPFCLLDEVDAPLDDYNTQKFIELIKQKSSKVQFICITHNKLTMQAGSQLLGVTMEEPGVSRVVAVDIEKTMELTQ